MITRKVSNEVSDISTDLRNGSRIGDLTGIVLYSDIGRDRMKTKEGTQHRVELERIAIFISYTNQERNGKSIRHSIVSICLRIGKLSGIKLSIS